MTAIPETLSGPILRMTRNQLYLKGKTTMAWMETPKSRRRMLLGGAGVLAGTAAATALDPFTAAQAQQMSVDMFASTGAAQAAEEWNPDSSYTTTDTGDGSYTVPMLNSDVPDISVERVPASQNDEGRDIYYMVSTTMHLSPGAPIMKSYDLVNWEIVNYAFDRLDISDAASLRNGSNSYGQGQWASSIRFHEGTFYVLINSLNLGGAFLYRTDDIENGAWTRTAFGRGFHDPSLFFDDANGGTPYIIYGGVSAVRLNPTLTAVEQDFPDFIRRSDYASEPYVGSDGIFEGAQVFFIDGYYYVVMITWRSNGRQVVMFRSTELLGRLADTAAPYESHGALASNGFAQGSLVPIKNDAGGDDWHGFFFRDSYPVGRIPALIPATWSNGWPTFGDNGVVPVDGVFEKPIRLTPEQERFERLKSIVVSDDFDNDAPHRAYQDEQWTLPTPPDIDEDLVGVELFGNPGVESGNTEGWIANDGATLSTTTDAHTGSTALAVTGRNATGSGPAQDVTGKVQHGVTYDVSAWVKYDNPASPATKQFLITARYGGGSTTYTNLTPATAVTRGSWGKVSGSFTIPATQALSDVRIFIETPWVSDPSTDPDTHLMDYKVDDVSLIGQPSAVAELPHPDEIASNGSNLDLAWEWNHTPDNRYWSLTDREGWLRLTAGKVVTGAYTHRDSGGELTWLEEARNTLSQRSFGPRQSAETKLDISGMNDGDVAGLAAFGQDFSYIAVQRVNGVNTVGVVHRGRPFTASIDQAAIERFLPGATAELGDATEVHLKADLDFTRSEGQLFTTLLLQLGRGRLDQARRRRRTARVRRIDPLHGAPGRAVQLCDPADRRPCRLRLLPAERHPDGAESAARQERPGCRDRLRRIPRIGRLSSRGVGGDVRCARRSANGGSRCGRHAEPDRRPRASAQLSARPPRNAEGAGPHRLVRAGEPVQNAATNDGAIVVQYSDWDGTNQQWQLVR